jgi:ABC-2 type transport system ATP-binding protein
VTAVAGSEHKAGAMPILEVRDVTFAYGTLVALSGVSISVRPGEALVLLGRNGAGKTTLLNLAAGLAVPRSGSVVVPHGRAQTPIGYAAQDVALYPALSVSRNLVYFARLNGLGRKEANQAAQSVAEECGLTDLLRRPVYALSNGQQRVAHVACALVHGPEVVLLDEPTAGVDVETRHRLIELVNDLAHVRGRALVYSTHYLGEVEDVDARIVVLDCGRIVKEGTATGITSSLGRAVVTAKLSGRVRVPGGTWVDGAVRLPAADPVVAVKALLAAAEEAGERVEDLRVERPRLEDAIFPTAWGSPGSDGPAADEALDHLGARS